MLVSVVNRCEISAPSLLALVELVSSEAYALEVLNLSDNPMLAESVVALSTGIALNRTLTEIGYGARLRAALAN